MKLTTSSLLVAVTLLGAAVMPAQANNDAMLELLKVLRDQGTITEQNYQLLVNAANADKQASAETNAKVAQVEATTAVTEEKVAQVTQKVEEAPSVSLQGGHLKMKSADGEFTTQIGGRVMLDAATFSDDLGDESGSEVRRARLFMTGKMYNDWDYKFQIGYAGNKVSMKDMYISYNGLDSARLRVGNHKMPLGLEQQTSSKYITFMERSILTGVQEDAGEAGRAMGISSFSHGDNWTAAVAAHLEGTTSALDFNDNEDWGWGGRVSFAPIAEKTQNIHLGASFHHQEYENNGRDLGLSFRPEAHLSPVKPFTTGNIGTMDDGNAYGLEAATVWGPFSLQTEYAYFALNSAADNTASNDPDFSTWYLMGSWFITGESRNYAANKGEFGRVKPHNVVGQGGTGAWEVALRYSEADLENGDLGNTGDITTIGLNWYATPTIRFMANYNWTHVDNDNTGEEDVDGNVLQVRGQVDF